LLKIINEIKEKKTKPKIVPDGTADNSIGREIDFRYKPDRKRVHEKKHVLFNTCHYVHHKNR
jgi:hypothetical protein